MKKFYKGIVIVFIMILLLIISFSKVYAAESILDEGEINYSKSYEEWKNLSDEEKSTSVIPTLVDIEYNRDSQLAGDSIIIRQFNNLFKAISDDLEYYNLADEINITVKDQGYTGECWAFSITSVLETTYSKIKGQVSDTYSPRHIDYSTLSSFKDKDVDNNVIRDVGSGGNFIIGTGYLARGDGPVLEEDMPAVVDKKEELINSSEIEGKEVQAKVKDAVYFPSIYKEYENGQITYTDGTNELSEADVEEIRNEVKEHIVTYGAVFAGIPATLNGNYNSDTYAYYSEDDLLGHAVTIVGWDDNYSKENFLESNRPDKDGAWIVLNSYGTAEESVIPYAKEMYGEGYEGYIYVSYDDAIIENSISGIREISDVDYDNIYQYDDLGAITALPSSSGAITMAMFEKKTNSDEYLNEIGLFAIEDQYATVTYYDEETGDITEIISRERIHPGYNTIELDESLIIENDFRLLVTYESLNGTDSVLVPVELKYDFGTGIEYNPDISGKTYLFDEIDQIFYSYNDADFCVKAFTTNEEKSNVEPTSIALNKTGKINMNENTEQQLNATITPSTANSRTKITWESSNENVVTVNQVGKIEAKSTGDARITATTENGKSTYLDITVRDEDAIALDIDSEDDVSYVVGNEKDFSVSLFNIPDSEKENVSITVSDTEIAEITSIDRTGAGTGKINFTVRFKKAGNLDIFANITYNGSSFEYKFSCEIRDEETTVESIRVKTLPSKTTYNVGENLNLEGGVIEVTYSDGTTEDISMTDSKVVITGYDSSKTGTQTVTINYENKLATFSVQVREEQEEKTVTSIKIKTLPSKTTYNVGENLNLEGGVIEVTYSDGTTEDISMTDSKVVITGYDSSKTGIQTVTVNYENKLTTFSVQVESNSGNEDDDNEDEERTVTSIKVKDLPNKTSYTEGEELNLEGGTIEVTYSDGTTEEVSMTDSKVKVTGYDNEKIGMQMVTVTYENRATTFSVQVKAEEEEEDEEDEEITVRSIRIKQLPNKTTYQTGEELDLEGGIITVVNIDGTEQDIAMTDPEITVEGFNTFEVGVQQLTLRYGGQETTLAVRVEGEEVTGSGDDKGMDEEKSEEEKSEEEKSGEEKEEPVDTGDNIESYVVYMILSIGVIIFVTRKIKTI